MSAAGQAVAGPGATIVFLEPIPPSVPAADGEGVGFRIRRGRFEPSQQVVQRGRRVVWTNHDSIFHGVFSYSTGNAFDLGVFAPQKHRSAAFSRAGPVRFHCPIHAGERGVVFVAPSPHFTQARRARYALSRIPEGRYWLSAWSDGWVASRREVTLRSGEAARADLVLRPERD